MTTQLPEKFESPRSFKTTVQDITHKLTSSYVPASQPGKANEFRDPYPASLIFSPSEGHRVPAGDVIIKGYAVTSIFREVQRVELSIDNGVTWLPADLSPNPQPGEWRLWRKSFSLTPGQYTLTVRAADNAPEKNTTGTDRAWHQVCFEVVA